MNKRIKSFVAVIGVVFATVLVVLNTQNTFAYYQDDKFYKMGFYNCWYSYLKDSFSYAEIENIRSTKDLFQNDPKMAGVPELDNVLTCSEIFNKYNVKFPTASGSNVVTFGGKTGFLESIGYEAASSGRGATFTFSKYVVDGNSGSFDPDQDGNDNQIVTGVVSVTAVDEKGNIANGASVDAQGSHFVKKWNNKGEREICLRNPNNTVQEVCVSYIDGMTNWDDFIDNLHNKIKDWFEDNRCTRTSMRGLMADAISSSVPSSNPTAGGSGNTDQTAYYNSVCFGGLIYESTPDKTANDTYKKASGGVKTAYQTAFGSELNYPADLVFTKEEATLLYNDYLKNYYGAKFVYCAATEEEATKKKNTGTANGDYVDTADRMYLTKQNTGGDSVQYCYTYATKNADGTVYGIDESNRARGYNPSLYKNPGRTNFEKIVKWLLENGADNVDSETIEAINNGEDTSSEASEDSNSGDEDPCFSISGAVGWALCPVLNIIGDTLDWAYENVVEKFLMVDPGVVSAMAINTDDDSSAIYKAWGYFRDFANVVFVILFLIVIFSQVTGYGIDNYGIKRMLPRLIIAAILVNFSFLICQLAVDISNILGASVKQLFETLGDDAVQASTVKGMGAVFHSFLEGFGVLGVGLGASALIFGAGKAVGWGFLATIGLSVLTGLISVFFTFVLLTARQAVIIVLVVISPLAIVLYMLPNTNRYFRQYVNIFSRMLIVYPAAGLLMGGGYFAARIVSSTSEAWLTQVVGLLLMIIPFFFIIPLVRSSMNAIAGLGGRIQAIGSGLRRGANSAVANSDWYKDKVIKMNSWGTGKALGDPNATGRFSGLKRGLNAVTRRRGVTAARQAEARNKWEQEMRQAAITQEEMANGPMPDGVYEERLNDALAMDLGDKNRSDEVQKAMSAYFQHNRKGAAQFLSRYVSGEDFSRNLREKGASGRSVSDIGEFQKYFTKNGADQAELDKRDNTAMDLINMGGGEYDANTGQMTYRDIHGVGRDGSVNANLYGGDQKMEDLVNHNSFVTRRDYADGRIDPNMSAQMVGPNAPASIAAALKGSVRSIHEEIADPSKTGFTAAELARRYSNESRVKRTQKTALSLSGKAGSNVTGQSGVVTGYMPTESDINRYFSGTFNATEAFKTNDGHVILSDGKGLAWDATTASKADYGQVTSNIMTRYNS